MKQRGNPLARIGTTVAAVALITSLVAPVGAVDPVPDWKTLIFPTLVPKAGMGNAVPGGLASGTIRQQFESQYEEYWKETSYYDYDHTTGAKIRGYFNDTKTYGYTQVPWAINPPTGTAGGSMGGERFRDGWRRTYLVYNGKDSAPQYATTTTDRYGNQWYFADACDADIAWTPGESFFDTNGNRKWDPAIPAEDYWNSDHYNGNTFLQRRNAGGVATGNLNVILPGGTYRPVNNTAAYFASAGELFVDFNDSNEGGAVLAGSGPGYDDAVNIYYHLGGQQLRIVGHNEIDFTPFDATTINEGDAAHTVVIAADPANNNPAIPVNVPRNGTLDFTSDAAGTPQVTAIGRYVQYAAYVYTNAARDAIGWYRYEDHWEPANGIFPATPNLTNTNLPIDRVGVRNIRAFIYSTRELYAINKAPNEYGDEPGNPPPGRVVAVDSQWTQRTPGEKFEDFLSFRDAAGNMVWVDLASAGGPGYIVSTNIGQVHDNVLHGRDRVDTIDWATYVQYVTWNYPGNATSLIARAGNGRYDAPEEWQEAFNKKITPSDTTIATLEPIALNQHWLDQWFTYASWADWYADTFGNGATFAPAFPAAVQQANTYTPVNTPTDPGNAWIPVNTWAYDSPAEFCDLPSSMYHLGGDPANALTLLGGSPTQWQTVVQGIWNNPSINAVAILGGDLALGEETSPWSTAMNGQDLWSPDPGMPAGPDGIITSAGPFGYNNVGLNGFDAADILSLELLTRKVDGVPVADTHPIQLRDTNLDGIWDNGNARTGQAYYNAGGDGSGAYPFNRQRFMEDVIAAWDHAENFVDLGVPTTGLPGLQSVLYGFPIYPNATNAGWGALGGPAGAVQQVLVRDTLDPIGITFQVRPMNGRLNEAPESNPGTNGAVFSDFGMAILCHEQGHDIMGWPDLYDYDVWSTTGGEIVNTPVAGYDLMSGGGLVHGVANMKLTAGWLTGMKPLATVVPVGVGPVTLDLYPVDRFEDQYYQFVNANNPAEFLDLWYTANDSNYGVVGGKGLYITHQDFSAFGFADPIQQRINGHFTWEVVQADGLNQLQDAVNFGDAGDPFPGTSNNRTFSADGNPAARWWNQSDMGMRILNVEIPASSSEPARVTVERYDTSSPWPWIFNYADTDNDGIADAWELHFFGDLTTAGAATDYDRDGLNDLNEYIAGLNPMNRFSADPSQVIDDRNFDTDGDLVSNGDEQDLYGTSPSLPDTDDDGITDGVEITMGLNATNSLAPLVDRVLDITAGTTNYLRVPNGFNTSASSMRMAVTNFAVEGWVYPRSAAVEADLFVRSVNAASNFVNFRLAMDTSRRLVLSFTHVDGRTNAVLSAPLVTALPLETWSHVLASFDLASQKMQIFINGELVAWQYTTLRPMTGGPLAAGPVDLLVGRNFDGQMDEVRLWDRDPGTRTLSQLQAPFTGGESGLQAYYRFDDGSNSNGVSGNPAWQLGEVENFVTTFGRDWLTGWQNAASLAGSAAMILAPSNAPVLPGHADTDGDGMPDYWEILNGLDPNDASGINGALGDPDDDGLSNLGEYQLGYNPWDPDGDDDGVLDSLEDADGDGLPNNVEIDTYGSRPDLVDTDDDGLSDGEEVMGVDNFGGYVTPAVPLRKSSPIRSTDPVKMMSARFNGNGLMVVSNVTSHALQSWTIEAWVRPDVGADGIVLQRKVYNTMPTVNTNAINYEIGVTPGPSGTVRPYVRFVGLTTNGASVEVRVNGLGSTEIKGGSQVTGLIPAEQWSHIAGAYDQESRVLTLFVNGERASYREDAFAPWGLTGDVDQQVYRGVVTVGGGLGAASSVENGFEGYVDDVAIGAGAQDAASLVRSIEGRSPVLNALAYAGSVPHTASARMTAINEAVLAAHVPSQILVRLRSNFVGASARNELTGMGVRVLKSYDIAPIHLVEVPVGMTISQKLVSLRSNPNVLYAEPNYLRTLSRTPNDSSFAQMWGLNNTGQTGGTPDADIDATEAWSRSTGSRDVIVAILDSGCDTAHPDIAPNLWVNTGEIPGNGIDDDGNGYIDDVNGYDFANGDAVMEDWVGHGTHTAGTVGAAGNNALGVVGVNWNVQLMICKVGDFFISSDAIVEAIQYAWRNGARVSNNSYGGYFYTQAEYDAINAAGQAGHLFVAAAGNESNDNDAFPAYPASFDLPNIVSVAASDSNDLLADFSNYGATTVDLAAPGVGILSTVPGGYDIYDGTSMASPHVAGVAALMLAANPNLGYAALKAGLMAGADRKTAMEGSTVTGARLNAANSVGGGGAYLAYYTFNDGGQLVEDFAVANGWETGWATAGRFINASFSTNYWVRNDADSDRDGIPDWWEIAAGLGALDGTGANGASGDPDNDGLSNLAEYQAGLNPFLADSDADGTLDGDEDSDGDGLSNRQEQLAGTNAGTADTDDDGVRDGVEITMHTSPTNSYSPVNYRAVQLTGSQRLKVVNETSADVTGDWTVEAWVSPAAASQNAILVRRAERYAYNGARWIDYELGLSNGTPYLRYAFRIDSTQVVESVSAIRTLTPNAWTHIAGVRDTTNHQIRIYVDGQRVAQKFTSQLGPDLREGTFETVFGGGDLSAGSVLQGFNGKLDAVRIWPYARSGFQIQHARGTLLPEFLASGLPDVTYAPTRLFNFDDGGVTAENSRYPADWNEAWRHVAVAEGASGTLYSNLLVTAPFPPTTLDSDDDCLSDIEERAGSQNENFSEYPYIPRFLHFDGTGKVVVDEVVDATDTHLYALTNWTVEAWVRPNALITNRMPLVSRHTRDGDYRTFEIGLVNTSGTVNAYAKFTRADSGDHSEIFLSSREVVPVGTSSNSWTHIAAVRSNGWFALFVNGEMAVRSEDPTAVPEVGNSGYLEFGATNFVGDLQEIRIWNRPRTALETQTDFHRTLLFGASSQQNSLLATEAYAGRPTQTNENPYHLDYREFVEEANNIELLEGHFVHQWTLEAWVKMEPGSAGGIVLERRTDRSVNGIDPVWVVNHSLRINGEGNPVGYLEGTVTIYTPVTVSNVVVRYDSSRADRSRGITSEMDIRDGQWHHLAFVGDGQLLSLYIDGRLDILDDNTHYYTLIDLAGPSFEGIFNQWSTYGSVLRIGVDQPEDLGTGDYFDGLIDEAMFWNEPQSADDILRHKDYGITKAELVEGLKVSTLAPENAYDDGLEHHALASYVPFDGRLSAPFIPDLASDQLYISLPQSTGAEIVSPSAPPIFIDPIRAFQLELVGYFTGSDCGKSVENYAERNTLQHAGLLVGGVTFVQSTAVSAPLEPDSDGDTLPDWWETLMGLDPRSNSGIDGMWGDADGDGLNNRGEYLAGLDPYNFDSRNTGFSDYYATSNVSSTIGMTYGEMYDDNDGISDLWELNYPAALSPLRFDAYVDYDQDGWDNYSEFKAQSDPTDGNSYPAPELNIRVNYAGNQVSGPIVARVYNNAAMDGIPSATVFIGPTAADQGTIYTVTQAGLQQHTGSGFSVPISPSTVNIQAGPLAFIDDGKGGLVTVGANPTRYGVIDYESGQWTLRTAPTILPIGTPFTATWRVGRPVNEFPFEGAIASTISGHLRQGNNWLFVWADNNGNSTFDAGEPAGVVEALPANVQYAGPVALTVNLTDDSLIGLPRFSWDPTLVGNSVTVRIVRSTSAGAPVVLERTNLTGRSYFTEADYAYTGPTQAMYGLPATSDSLKPGYTIYISGSSGTVTRTYNADWSMTLAAPVPVSPNGGILVFAKEELVWTQDVSVTKNIFEVRAGSPSAPLFYLQTNSAPVRDPDGLCRMDFPYLFGSGLHTNGTYYYRIYAANPRQTSAPSAWTSYTVNLSDSPSGAYSINGRVEYYGKVKNFNIRVEAYESPAFSGKPVARLRLTSAKTDYSLKGLRAGTYYVRAFVEVNNNILLDPWESWGVLKDTAQYDAYYSERAVTVPGNAYNMPIMIIPHDADEDGMGDDWEVENFGSLTLADYNSDTDGDTLLDRLEYSSTSFDSDPNVQDTDGDGLLDGLEVLTTGTDPTKADTDGDGLSDGVELTYGSNPLVTDTDGDGVPDGLEKAKGASSTSWDTDGDGYSDAIEIALGTSPTNAAQHPASKALFRMTGVAGGSGTDLVTYSREPTATNLQYGIQVILLTTTDPRSNWTDAPFQVRSLSVTNWATGPWTSTNSTDDARERFYSVKWLIP